MKKIIIIFFLFTLNYPNSLTAQINQEWVATYSGTGTGGNYAVKNAIDKFGDIIVAGRSDSAEADYIVLKYNPGGNLIWKKRYNNNTYNSDDYLRDMILDDSGNIYVTGFSYEGTSNGGVNWLTIKYSSSGNMRWKQSLDWTGHKGDDAFAVAIDKNYNVYVTGYGFVGPPPLLKEDLVLAKYNINGEFQWARSLSSSSASSSVGYSLITDQSNDAIVTGYTGNRIAIAKYDEMGNQIWHREYFRNSGNLVAPSFSKLDKENNIIVNGFYSLATQDNFVTVKYNSEGNLLWSRIFDSPIGAQDYANTLYVDDSSNIYISGSTFTNFYFDVFVVKYGSDGDSLWLRTYDYGYSQDDEAKSITEDKFGNVYLTGSTYLSPQDFLTLKYNSEGDLIWTQTYSTHVSPPGPDFGISIILDEHNNVYVSGSCYFSNTSYGITSIKYSQLTNILNENKKLANSFKLSSYPNPFNPVATIKYELPADGIIKLKIADIKGRIILTLINEYETAGKYNVSFQAENLPSGVYYCVLENKNAVVQTLKLLLIK